MACGSSDPDSGADGGGQDTPRITSNEPADSATNVALNGTISATFSEAMDPDTLSSGAFTLTRGATPVPGIVIYRDSTAVFWPALHLASNETYTATVSTDARSDSGIGLEASTSWTFTTGDMLVPAASVNLGTAGDFVMLAKSGISTVPTSAVTGDLGVSPAAASFITGFSLTADASNEFSTSPQVTGKVYAADYAVPTPALLTAAIGDMELALTEAAGRAPDSTELGAGNIGGMTLAPGVYKWGTGLLIPTDLTLDGSSTDVWVFQIAQGLTVSSATQVILTGGAEAKNVFWQVSGSVELGTGAHLEGVILGQTSITLATGASVTGRVLAQTAIDIDGATVVEP
ncbi:MAG TPA: ice-binding family protein [Kofleriaceae bacterium]|nr:ice-binding family protein [Kofleriaceae bacterium]